MTIQNYRFDALITIRQRHLISVCCAPVRCQAGVCTCDFRNHNRSIESLSRLRLPPIVLVIISSSMSFFGLVDDDGDSDANVYQEIYEFPLCTRSKIEQNEEKLVRMWFCDFKRFQSIQSSATKQCEYYSPTLSPTFHIVQNISDSIVFTTYVSTLRSVVSGVNQIWINNCLFLI